MKHRPYMLKMAGSLALVALALSVGSSGTLAPPVRANGSAADPSNAQRVAVRSFIRATEAMEGAGPSPTAHATTPVSTTVTMLPSPTPLATPSPTAPSLPASTSVREADTSTTAVVEPTVAPTVQPEADATEQPGASMTARAEVDGSASAQPDSDASATAQPDPGAHTSTPVESSVTATAHAVITGTVRVRLLHLREGPGATYPIRASYGRDARLEVLGTDRTRGWLRVVTADERAGWMAVENVALAHPAEQLPIVDGTTDQTTSGASTSDGTAALPPPSDVGIPATSGLDADAPISSITDAPEGVGMIIVPATGLRVAPGVRTELVRVLHEHEQVKLFGQARGAWVRVQPFTSVVPGWVYAAHLEPLPGTIAGAPADTTALAPTVTPTLATVTPTRTAAPTPVVVDAQPAPIVAPTAVPLPVRLPVEVVVQVIRADQARSTRRSATPTPAAIVSVAGLRVELVDVFGDVLAEAVTPPSGRVVFNRDVGADTALFVQIRALGLRASLDAAALAHGRAEVTVALPSTP